MENLEFTEPIVFTNDDRTNIDVYVDLFVELVNGFEQEMFLKGNVLLNKILPDSARGTVHMDMSVLNEKLYYDVIVPRLEKFGKECLNNGLASEYSIREIGATRSGGIDVKKDTKKIYSVDVRVTEAPDYAFCSYSFGNTQVMGSSLEKIVCDKVLATLSRKRFRRAKDFYDLYILYQDVKSINYPLVFELMCKKSTSEDLNRLFNNFPFSEDILLQLAHAWEMLQLRTATGEDITKPDFPVIYGKIYKLYQTLKELWEHENS